MLCYVDVGLKWYCNVCTWPNTDLRLLFKAPSLICKHNLTLLPLAVEISVEGYTNMCSFDENVIRLKDGSIVNGQLSSSSSSSPPLSSVYYLGVQMVILRMRSRTGGSDGQWRWLTSDTGDSTNLLLLAWETLLMLLIHSLVRYWTQCLPIIFWHLVKILQKQILKKSWTMKSCL